MTKLIPDWQLGYVLPVLVGDHIHHQFYRAAPDSCFLVCYPLSLGSFSVDGVEAALQSFDPAIDFLHGRGVDRISQGGIPISAYAGRKRTLSLIENAQKRTGIPCSADFEETIEALHSQGLRKVVIGAKWSPELMGRVAEYLADAGIEVVGYVNETHSAHEVVALDPAQGLEVALSLGRKAFETHPEADGMLLAGGSWPCLEAVRTLEREFGRPVIANPQATYWAAFRQFGVEPMPGFGTLLDSLRGDGAIEFTDRKETGTVSEAEAK